MTLPPSFCCRRYCQRPGVLQARTALCAYEYERVQGRQQEIAEQTIERSAEKWWCDGPSAWGVGAFRSYADKPVENTRDKRAVKRGNETVPQKRLGKDTWRSEIHSYLCDARQLGAS